ncbi:MAG: hypothetical protein ACXIT9_08395 [Nitritalea sp.]
MSINLNPSVKSYSILLIVIFFSCVSNQKVLQQWAGANENELLEKWGDPDRIDREGNTDIWIYERFGNKLPGTTGARSYDKNDEEGRKYDENDGVKFIINRTTKTIIKYELIGW